MKNKISFVLVVALVTMWTVVSQAQSLKTDWTRSISGQRLMGLSEASTVSIPTTVTSFPFSYQVHSWDVTGNSTKIAEGTTNTFPHILIFTDKILVNKSANESVKILSSTGTVIAEKIIPATLGVNCPESDSRYFYTGEKLVRVTFVTNPASKYSTKVEAFDDQLNKTDSMEIIGMEFVAMTGNYLAGNIDDKGQIINITDTTQVINLSTSISDAMMHNNELFVLAGGKLYNYNDGAEAWNKSVQGTKLAFLGHKIVTFGTSSATLYDSLANASLSTLNVSINNVVGISSVDNAIYVATTSSLTKISYFTSGGGGGTGIAETETSSLKIYPNPTTDFLSVEELQNPEMEILTATGMVAIPKQKTNTINVSLLPAGVYICRINGINKPFIKR